VTGTLPTGSSVALPGSGRVLDFRRRAAPPRRKRRSVWVALLRPLLTALTVVGLPLAVSGWVLTSPRFRLADLAIDGARRVPLPRLYQALAPLRGKNLVRLPLSEVKSLLAAERWVDAVEIEKELPHRLRVRIRERRPAVLLEVEPLASDKLASGGTALAWGDDSGRPIEPVAPGEDTKGFLVVRADRSIPQAVGKALGVAAELRVAEPDWAATLSSVDVLGEDDYRLVTRTLPFPLLVRRGQVAANVQRLLALLPELGRRYTGLAAVDLRSAERIVIEPAVGPGAAKPAARAAL
jgi:cell division septal protein FtsQ